jgi:CheY-like chemotaxis protein
MGAMLVDSTVGKGSCFNIYLPRPPEDASQKKSPSTTQTQSVTGSETILFAEDEESVRRLVTVSLRQLGYTVFPAANGEEALALIKGKEDEIALLLTDIIMPKMGGIELTQSIVDINPACKIMFISGYAEDGDAIRSILDKDILFLKKPFSPMLLAEKVREVLDGR